MSFAKMLKEKKLHTYGVPFEEIVNAVRWNDLGFWFWDNGGKQYYEYKRKGFRDIIVDLVEATADYESRSPKHPMQLEAFCFLRCIDLLGKEWVEAKIKEIEK